jgi:hypothetical protein
MTGLVWIHEGWQVLCARGAKCTFKLRPTAGEAYSLLVTNAKGTVLLDDVGPVDDLMDRAEKWLNERRNK